MARSKVSNFAVQCYVYDRENLGFSRMYFRTLQAYSRKSLLIASQKDEETGALIKIVPHPLFQGIYNEPVVMSAHLILSCIHVKGTDYYIYIVANDKNFVK